MSDWKAIDQRTLSGPRTVVSTGGETDRDPIVVQYVEWHRDPVRGRVIVVPSSATRPEDRDVVNAPTQPDALDARVKLVQSAAVADPGAREVIR
jgi:hypothetical protein